MATDASLAIIITARDEATQALVNVERQIVQSTGRIARSGEAVARGSMQMTQGLQTTTRAIAGLNTSLLSQLDPALARTAASMSAMVGVTRPFGPAFMAVAAAAAVGAASLGSYLSILADTARRQAELNRAATAFDLSGVVNQIRAMRVEIETLDRSPAGRLSQMLQAGPLGPAARFFGLGATREALQADLEDAGRIAAGLAPGDREIALKAEGLKALDAARAYQQLEAERAKEALSEERLGHAHGNLNALLETQIEFERELIQLRARRSAAALEAGGAPREVVENVRIEAGAQLAILAETARNRRLALAEQRRLGLAGIRERTPSGLPSAADEDFTAGMTETQALMFGRDFARAARNEERARAIEIYGIHGRQLDLARNLPTFTRGQQEAVERELSFRRETLGLEVLDVEARRQPERRDVIDAQRTFLREEERVVRQRLDVERGVRTEAAAGLAAELARLEEEFDASGDRMAAGAREIATTMHRAFSDGFFTVLTGDFKKLPDLGRDIGRQMIRMLSDELARMALSPIVSQLRAAFGGGGGLGGFSLTPAGALRGGGSVLNFTGASSAQLAALSQNGYTITRTATGQTFAVPSIGGAPAPGALREFLDSPILRQPAVETTAAYRAAYQQAHNEVMAAGGTAAQADAAGRAAGNVKVTTGVTIGQVTGYAAAVAAAGLSAYAIYQGARAGGESGQPEATGYLTGGLQGAVTGAGIGAFFGPYGLVAGAAIGLVAGGVLGGVAASEGARVRKRARRRQERRARARLLAEDIRDAVSAEDLVSNILQVRVRTGTNTVGGLLLGLAFRYGDLMGERGTEFIDFLGRHGAQPESAMSFDVLNSVGEFAAVLGDALGGADEVVRFLEGVFGTLEGRASLEELVAVSFDEVTPTRALTRRTFLPFTGARQLPAGRFALSSSRPLLRDLGASEEMIEALLRSLRAVNYEKDIVRDLGREDFLRELS